MSVCVCVCVCVCCMWVFVYVCMYMLLSLQLFMHLMMVHISFGGLKYNKFFVCFCLSLMENAFENFIF